MICEEADFESRLAKFKFEFNVDWSYCGLGKLATVERYT